jgi:hypothetical protein
MISPTLEKWTIFPNYRSQLGPGAGENVVKMEGIFTHLRGSLMDAPPHRMTTYIPSYIIFASRPIHTPELADPLESINFEIFAKFQK